MTENKTKKVSEIKLNVNYVSFVAKLHSSKIAVTEKNKESIKALYAKEVGLRFTNLPRVSTRATRAKLKPVLETKLSEAKLSRADFDKINVAVLEIAKKKSSTYA